MTPGQRRYASAMVTRPDPALRLVLMAAQRTRGAGAPTTRGLTAPSNPDSSSRPMMPPPWDWRTWQRYRVLLSQDPRVRLGKQGGAVGAAPGLSPDILRGG